MASNYTEHYDLCQWEAADQVQRTDFNADNAKVDAALDGLEHGKAAQDEVDVLTDTVAALTETITALSGNMGNCTIYRTSYVGTGTYGTESPNSITFPKQPLVVLIGDCGTDGRFFHAIYGMTKTFAQATGYSVNNLGWSGNTLTWNHHMGPGGQLNSAGVTYQVVALLQAGA